MEGFLVVESSKAGWIVETKFDTLDEAVNYGYDSTAYSIVIIDLSEYDWEND